MGEQPQWGCRETMGCLVLIVVGVFVWAAACTPSSPSPPVSPSQSTPVGDPGLQSLCEGSDYLKYDDCK